MSDPELAPARFGAAFKAFMEAVVAEAPPPGGPLFERIGAHLGADPAQLPVIAEEFDSFEHPNVQVALDAYLEGADRRATLIGVAADNKRFMAFGLSDLLSRGGLPGRPALAEGPVDYVNFHLAGDRVLPCVQFGLYLVADGDARLVVFVAGPNDRMGPRVKVRVEVLAARREDGQAFLTALVELMRRHNVYRGQVISLSPGQMGPGPQTLVAFHALPRSRGTRWSCRRACSSAWSATPSASRAGRAPAGRRALAQARPAALRPAGGRQDTDGDVPHRPHARPDDDPHHRARHGPLPVRRAVGARTRPGDGRAGGRRPDRRGARPALRGRPAPLRTPQRDGRPARRLRRDLRPHHQPGGHPRTGAGRAPGADRPRRRAAAARRRRPAPPARTLRARPRAAGRGPRRARGAHRGRQPRLHQGIAPQGGRAGSHRGRRRGGDRRAHRGGPGRPGRGGRLAQRLLGFRPAGEPAEAATAATMPRPPMPTGYPAGMAPTIGIEPAR